jgi:carbamoyltransferase
MNIMGVHIGHDSSAALVRDGKLVADVAEERFSRTKHFGGVPVHSIEYCLQAGGLSIDDIDFIAVPQKGPNPLLNHLFALRGHQIERGGLKHKAYDYVQLLARTSQKKPPLYWKTFPFTNRTEVFHVEHHLAHAANAYYVSGFNDKALIVTCDGAGDGFSLCIWRGENGRIVPLHKMGLNASLGWFYSNVTEALGWIHGDGEGKTMGLAPYGDAYKCKGVLDEFYPKFSSGELVEGHNFGTAYYWNESGATEFHFDEAYKIKRLVDKYGTENIAAEAQRVLEEQLLNVILPWMERENTRSLCCSGGVFLNVKLNQRIWYSGKVAAQFVYPNCGDSGLAHGAALECFYRHSSTRTTLNRLEHLYWGPEFSDAQIEKMLKERNLRYRVIEDIEATTADLLAKDQIVGWFQGRMESGPRALGARSILMSAGRSENKDIVNAKVKFREPFRPFCPSILYEAKDDYLLNSRIEPFMITSFDTIEEMKQRIPAVVHVDGTARPQTVVRETNPLYWNLLKAFGELTGDPVLMNTSFNIKGEPIICHPREAVRCFFDSGIDFLIMGNVVLDKKSL